MAFGKFKRQREEQLDAELRFHLERLTQEKVARGLSPDQARRETVLEFGGQEQVKEDLRDVYRFVPMETALRNLWSGLRLIRKSPSFSLAVVLTLTLGIGANSTVFSAINAVLLRPLPYPRAHELVALTQFDRNAKNPSSFAAPQRLEDWNRLSSTLQAASGWYVQDVSELSGAVPEKMTEALVAPRFLQVWGISPALGRDFSSTEEHYGGPNAVLISDRLWKRRFHGEPAAIGRQLRLEKASYTIIGVLPASFRFPVRDTEVWVPSPPDSPFAQGRESTWFTVIGRMKPGVTTAHAQADMRNVQIALGRKYPKPDANLSVRVESLKETTIGGIRQSLWMLFGAVTLLLVIACMNVAALLLARTADRAREISVRFSLGASRSQVVIQLLTECIVLALPGAALGLIFAAAGTRILRAMATSIPRGSEIVLDWRIAAYTFACSVAAALLCGLLPALRGTKRSLSAELAAAGRTQVSHRNRWQWMLVGVQVSLAVTLLVGAGLFIRSFEELGRVFPGFESTHILTLRISGNWGETADFKKLTARIDRSLDAMRSVPGIRGAATATPLPGEPSGAPTELRIVENRSAAVKILAESRFVSDGYFETMHIPLLEGETCTRQHGGAIVNRSFATTYLDGARSIGHHLQLVSSQFMDTGRIAGIVGDAREQGLNREPSPTVYWCMSAPLPSPYFLIRTYGEPFTMANALRNKMQELEPARSVFDISPLDDHLSENMAANRLRTWLLTMFAATAVALVCVGLYGTMSYFVNVRRREIGLRLAIGASRGQIVRQFLAMGVLVCLLGCLAGLPVAAAAVQGLGGMLYGISPLDTQTFVSVTGLTLAVGAFASLLPSLRASRVEPMQVLRDD